MTALELEILDEGCGDLTALQWCREALATVKFLGDGSVGVSRHLQNVTHFGETLPAAVLRLVRVESGRKP